MPTVTIVCPVCHLPLSADCKIVANSDGDDNVIGGSRSWRELDDYTIVQTYAAPDDDRDNAIDIDHAICLEAIEAFQLVGQIRQQEKAPGEYPNGDMQEQLWNALSKAALDADDGGYDDNYGEDSSDAS